MCDKALKNLTELYEKCSDEMRRLGLRVKELYKENIQLYSDIETYIDEQKTLEHDNKELLGIVEYKDKQIAEAKALLKQWMQTTQASGCDNINIVTDTENILKE